MQKWNVRTGETLLEMALSMFVISMAMLILSGAAFTVARVNGELKRMLNPAPASPGQFEATDFPRMRVQLEDADGDIVADIPVQVTRRYNGDLYYEPAPNGDPLYETGK